MKCALAAILLVVAACVGDTPTSSGAAASSSSGDTTSASSGGPNECDGSACISPSPCADGAPCDPPQDAATCEAPRQRCGESCIAVDTDGQNCGSCGHSCGGASCAQGRCQPLQILQGSVNRIEVTGTSLVASRSASLVECPLDGTCDSPREVFASSRRLGEFAVADGKVTFMEQVGVGAVNGEVFVSSCPLAACGTPTAVAHYSGAVATGMSVGPTHVVWSISSSSSDWGSLHAQPRSGGSPIVLADPKEAGAFYAPLAAGSTFAAYHRVSGGVERLGVQAFASGSPVTIGAGAIARIRVLEQDRIWFAAPASATTSQITSVGPGLDQARIVATEPKGIVDFVVLEGILYTLNASTREVRKCQVSDCANTGVVLATGQVGLRQVEVSSAHVFWIGTTGLYRLER